jgi:hypothetical protein
MVRDRDPRMARRILGIGIAISVVGILISVAVTIYSDSVINRLATTPLYQTPTTTLPSITTPLSSTLTGGATHTWTISMTTSLGDTASAEIEVGSPETFQDGITNGDATAGTACSLNPGTDEVIPADIIMTNTSTGDLTVGVDVSGIGQESIPSFTGPELIWEAEYSAGPQCAGQDDGNTDVNIYSEDEVQSGAGSTTDGFFEITNFVPQSSTGVNTGVLGDAILTVPTNFEVSPDGDGTGVYTDFTVTGVSGPGVVQNSSGWEFTLAGTDPPS